MRVLMLNTESGRYPGMNDNDQYHCLAGHEYEVVDELARAWVRKGIAKRVRKKSKPKEKVKNNGD